MLAGIDGDQQQTNFLSGVMKMKTFVPIIIFIVFLIASINSSAEQLHGARLLDQGLDGDVRYFNVICPDKERTTLTYNITTKEICITYSKGSKSETCKDGWNKDQAAQEACK